MEMWSQVRKFQDGDSLNAKTLNIPVGQLGDRTDYLYSRIMDLLSGDKLSSVVITGVPLSDDGFGYPEIGNAVYLHQYENEETLFASKAKAAMSMYDDFKAADSAFSVGILQSKDSDAGNVGNVLVYGKIGLDKVSPPIPKSNMIESGEEFRPGRYYLSSNEAGKLTSDPNGPIIYVGMIGGGMNGTGGLTGSAVINPQFLDIGTSHVHRTAVLKARPAGELSSDGLHVLGYGTILEGPFHLIFGGTWTGDKKVDYSFKVVEDGEPGSGYKLAYSSDAGDSWNYVSIPAIGEPVNVENGIKATLTCSDDSSSSYDLCNLDEHQKEWASLLFPDAGQGWVDHAPAAGSSSSSSSEDGSGVPIYEYVVGMDPQVSNYWPPVPPKSAALLVNGVEMDNAALFPKNPTVEFAKDTIYWFEDEYGRKPWPEDINLADRNPAYDKVMAMHWVRGFHGATGPVTSIQPKPGSPLKIYGYGTHNAANTGDLEIDAAIDFKIVEGGTSGFMVPKRSELGTLVAGPVVERVVGGPGISVVSTEGPNGQGTVVVSLSEGSYRDQFSDIALENAEQAKIGMFPYIRLRGYSGRSISSPSAFTAMMRVPTNMPAGRYAIMLSASVFGENGFTREASKKYACVNLTYNILPDFSAPGSLMYGSLKSSLIKPNSERIVNIPFGHTDSDGITYNGFDPVLLSTEDPDLENEDDVVEKVFGKSIPDKGDFVDQSLSPWLGPGYLVGVRISRAVTSQSLDAYTGPIGFVNLSWTLVQSDVKDATSNNSDKALDGVVIRVGTIEGIRTAVKTIGETFGATVVK